MFSVITHQLPEDAEILFRIFRRCVRPHGWMFFSATIREMKGDYCEMIPDRPTAHSAYSAHFLRWLLERTGWRIMSQEGKHHRGMPIQDSFLCAPDMTHRVDLLRCEGSDAMGAKRTCRERRKRVDLTKMTHLRHWLCTAALVLMLGFI